MNVAWYVARSSGLVAWALLTASVIAGVVIPTRVLAGRVKAAWMADLHRYLGGLATIFTAVHVGVLLLESYIHFDLISVLVPFASRWRPGAVAWGVVALYALVAVELTSLMRDRVSRRTWRMTHMLSYPLFLMATIHGLAAGTDARVWFVEFAAAVAIVAVSALVGVRVGVDTRRSVRA